MGEKHVKIRIKPEQVMNVTKQFQQAQTLAAGLRKSIYSLELQWNGVTREKFFQSFQQSNRIIDQYSRVLREIEVNLKDISVKSIYIYNKIIKSRTTLRIL
jgi:WXG100 family type VII secretion target